MLATNVYLEFTVLFYVCVYFVMSAVVEENSTENILRCCLQLKECLVKLEIISSALQTSLCNGTYVCLYLYDYCLSG